MFKSSLFLSLILLLAFPSFAEKTSLMVVTENLPPYQMQQNGKITGFATEIVEAIFEKTDINYQIKMYPWSRSYNLAQRKENICIYSIARIAEREKLFQWIQPIATSTPTFLSLKSNKKVKLSKLSDAKKYITAVIRDDITHHLLLKNGFKEIEHFYLVNNAESLLKLLKTRKNIDLIMIDSLTLSHRSKVDNIDPRIFIEQLTLTDQVQTFYLACSNQTPIKVVDTLNQALNIIKSDGTYKKIIDEWSIQYRGILETD